MKTLTNKNVYSSVKFFGALVSVLLVNTCGVDAGQRHFEQQALRTPQGITEMTVHGVPVENSESDPSDWQISPEFYGLLEIQTPAYPNPVSFNQMLKIDLYLNGIEALNELAAYIYQPHTGGLRGPFYQRQHLSPGWLTITLKPGLFAQTGTNGTNLYRIIIYDGANNMITYGDIKVK